MQNLKFHSFDEVHVLHYNYVGDSILGYRVHLGAGAITSNIKSDKTTVFVHDGKQNINTGLRKFGALIGDNTEIGCNTVLNQAQLLVGIVQSTLYLMFEVLLKTTAFIRVLKRLLKEVVRVKVIITKNYDELSKEAFKIMIDVIKNKPNACLGLATGTTPWVYIKS